jgi:hypothetical protein
VNVLAGTAALSRCTLVAEGTALWRVGCDGLLDENVVFKNEGAAEALGCIGAHNDSVL